MSIVVINHVKIYERDGESVEATPCDTLEVRSHWNDSNMVRLKIGGVDMTVCVRDLTLAIINSQNTN